MTSEMVVLVDEKDQEIGLAEKMHAHQHGLLHRAFSVFILRKRNDDFEVLLQQRNSAKYHCGGLWSNTCCSHPRENEDIIVAGQRRLLEEMGLDMKLSVLDSFIYRAEFSNGLVEHEYDHVLLGFYNDEKINLNPEEVQDCRWISIPELQKQLINEPTLYTPWLQPALNVVQKYIEQII